MEKGTWEYKAFISYRHNSFDRKVAVKLQKMLETFHILKKFSGEKQWKVFRDETELPTSDDLSQGIKEALEKSEFLIVICSETTKESRWCRQEMAYFKSLHNNTTKKILTVLISGDPSEVFPEEICWTEEIVTDLEGNKVTVKAEVEPLAANIVAGSERDSFKKLKGEFLRIAAPLLGISYDALKQRQRTYRYQKIMVVSGAVMAGAIAFSVYAYRQTATISRQAQEISKEYRQNLISQSKYYVKEAKELKESNNTIQAVEKLLLALPDEKIDRPVVSDAVFELADILNLYKSKYDVENTVTPVGYLEFGKGMENTFFMDSSGKYLFTSDRYTIGVRDAETFELVREIKVQDEGYIQDFENNFFVIDQNRILYCDGSNQLYCVDYLTGKVVWSDTETLGKAAKSVSLSLSEDQKVLAAVIYGQVYTFDAETGKKTGKWYYAPGQDSSIKDYLDEEKVQKPDIGDEVAISSDHRYIAFRTYQWIAENGYYDYPSCVYLLDTKENKVTVLQDKYHRIDQLLFSDNGQLFIMEGTSFVAYYNGQKNCMIGKNRIHCVDIQTKKQVWETATECSGSSYIEQMQIKDSPYDFYEGKVLFSTFCNQILALSCEEGKILQNSQYESPIADIQFKKDNILAVHENGSYSWNHYSARSKSQIRSIVYKTLFQKNLKAIRQDKYFYILEQDDSRVGQAKGIIKYQLEKQDSSYQEILKKEKQEDYFSYTSIGDGWQYAIKNNKAYFTDCNSGKQYEAEFPGEEEIESYDIKMLGFSDDHKKVYFYKKGFYENQFSIYQVNIEEQTTEEKKILLTEGERLEDIICANGQYYYVTCVPEEKNVKDKVVFKDSSKKLTEDDSDYIIKSYNKMRLYCWRQESNTGELLGEASLEERDGRYFFQKDGETIGMAVEKEEAEDYVSDSLTVSEDGTKISWCVRGLENYMENNMEESEGESTGTDDADQAEKDKKEEYTRSIVFDLKNGKSQSILPGILNGNSLYSMEKYQVSNDGKIYVAAYESEDLSQKIVTCFDEKGNELYSSENNVNIDKIGTVFFSKNNMLLWMLYHDAEDGQYKLTAYDTKTWEVRTIINFQEYFSKTIYGIGNCCVQWIDNTKFLLYDGDIGLIVDEQCIETGGLMAYISNCAGYNAEEQKIYVGYSSIYDDNLIEWGSFSYVPLEELIKQGQKFIH